MELSRKRKKELRKLQENANTLWESQQVLLGQAGTIAREAGRQLGHYNREQVVPAVADTYDKYAAPYVDKGVAESKKFYNRSVVPAAGAVVGSALSVWDSAKDTREKLAAGRGLSRVDLSGLQAKANKFSAAATKQLTVPVVVKKKRMGAGGVIAIIFGAAAALGVLYAAWQTLRADDELWVADDPLRAPDA